jgi:hypothetical protein
MCCSDLVGGLSRIEDFELLFVAGTDDLQVLACQVRDDELFREERKRRKLGADITESPIVDLITGWSAMICRLCGLLPGIHRMGRGADGNELEAGNILGKQGA